MIYNSSPELYKNIEAFILEKELGESYTNLIMHNIYYGNYLQIFFDNGIKFIESLLAFLENIEEYEECTKIYDTIEKHKKATGEQINLFK